MGLFKGSLIVKFLNWRIFLETTSKTYLHSFKKVRKFYFLFENYKVYKKNIRAKKVSKLNEVLKNIFYLNWIT